ncbi:MAG: hypothetical protein QXD43_01290 [Candidatus Aenigmatarchaeota archaeon]
MATDTEKQKLFDLIASTGAFRYNTEGNTPGYVASVLRGGGYIGRSVEIIGNFLEIPQKTVMKELKDVVVTHEITKLGNVQILQLIGTVEGSNYAVKKGKHYVLANKRSPHETMFTKVVKIKSGDLSREFLIDGKLWIPEQ